MRRRFVAEYPAVVDETTVLTLSRVAVPSNTALASFDDSARHAE